MKYGKKHSHHSLVFPRRNYWLPWLLPTIVFFLFGASTRADDTASADEDKSAFEQAAAGNWNEVFSDPATGDWEKKWFLDGEVGMVKTDPEGMTLTAGPEFKNDAHHMVLWTKESFSGDLKIEYDYTRLDAETRCVNILYIQATGSAEGPYAKDITKWNEQRRIPAMETYFNHMNTYHISYAAFPNATDKTGGYIRARRYIPEKNGIKGAELKPDYDPWTLFATGVKHHITVIKKDRDLFMRIENPDRVLHCHMQNPDLPAITEGRIGLRHMFTRSARYANFRISTADAEASLPEDELVAETHKASLKLREQALRKTIAKDTCWPGGVWGDNLWTLAALNLNERVDEANARLLKQANDYIEQNREHGNSPAPTPEAPGDAPWTFFSITDYVRTLCLFHSKSPHFPGRLKPETEAAMKEALWLWVNAESRIADAGPEDLFLLLGTENHDLNKRPNYYLVASLLKDDPAYKDRKLADGHTTAELAAAYGAFYREWPRSRAASGLWIEVGSNTYQKYSWPALFNLTELSPDPLIRKRFGLLLDLALIEEAQISVRGHRGGGRSRAYCDGNAFDSMKAMLYGEGGGSSHSRVIESSLYQVPPAAVLLRKRAFPATEPFVIQNRVLGESAPSLPDDGKGSSQGSQRIASDSSLVNYAYRTSDYLLGSTLQDPSINYAGISRQNRTCGLLFDDPAAAQVSQIHPVAEHTGGGRSQHSFWSVQHENVLLLQRIAARKEGGSYHTGRLGMSFKGEDLQKTEEDGWIFATNGKAYVGVKFIDGGYVWDEKKEVATPANFTGQGETTRILLHAGDAASYGSFENFCKTLRPNPPTVTADKVDYRFGAEQRIEMSRYNAASPENFTLPLINGATVDLHPPAAFQSPYLNGKFGGDIIYVSVGPIKRTLHFSGPSE
jgi:hypothetical protein